MREWARLWPPFRTRWQTDSRLSLGHVTSSDGQIRRSVKGACGHTPLFVQANTRRVSAVECRNSLEGRLNAGTVRIVWNRKETGGYNQFVFRTDPGEQRFWFGPNVSSIKQKERERRIFIGELEMYAVCGMGRAKWRG